MKASGTHFSSALAIVLTALLVVPLDQSLAAPESPTAPEPAQAQTLPNRTPLAEPGVEGTIVRLYRAAFNRPPDRSGLDHWVWRYLQGESLGDIAIRFTKSAEYAVLYADIDNDEEFVDRLYRNILGRAGEPAGLADWIDRLASGWQRWEVLIGFSESGENRARTATPPSVTPRDPIASGEQEAAILRLYRAAFLRSPDNLAMDTWTTALARGASIESVADDIAGSIEFQRRYGNLDAEEFYSQLFHNVYFRLPQARIGDRFNRPGVLSRHGQAALLLAFGLSSDFADVTRTPRWQPDDSAPINHSSVLIDPELQVFPHDRVVSGEPSQAWIGGVADDGSVWIQGTQISIDVFWTTELIFGPGDAPVLLSAVTRFMSPLSGDGDGGPFIRVTPLAPRVRLKSYSDLLIAGVLEYPDGRTWSFWVPLDGLEPQTRSGPDFTLAPGDTIDPIGSGLFGQYFTLDSVVPLCPECGASGSVTMTFSQHIRPRDIQIETLVVPPEGVEAIWTNPDGSARCISWDGEANLARFHDCA